MLTAFLTEVMGAGHVRLTANGWHVATYPVTQDDGPSPTGAARTVLAANGWQLTTDWEQMSGGVTGGEWVAQAEQAADSDREVVNGKDA